MATNSYEPGGDLVLAPGPGFRSGFVVPASELLERFSRSSGPGGQGVNTTDSRVELRWRVLDSPALARVSEAQRLRVESALNDRLVSGELIIFASEHPLPPQEDFFLARAARKRRNEWRSTDAAFAAYASKPPLDVMTEESLRAYVEYGLRERDGMFELKCRPEVEARVYSMGPNHGAFARLGEIGSNVRVVCGETSTDVGPPLASKIAERIPHGHLEVMAGLGHFGPQQDPDACVASILRFCAETV